MSIYEKPEALTKSEYKYLFDMARDNRQDIINAIFDKEKIRRFNEEYGILSERNLDYVIKALDEIQGDEVYTDLCCILYVFMKNGVNPVDIKPAESKTVKSEFALMLPFFACAEEHCADALKRGVDREILSTTLKAVDMYVTVSEKKLGIPGTSTYHGWLTRYAMGKLFRIGQFQFELCNYDGNDLISVHIPRGTVLNVKDNLLNFKDALSFFNKYYPEYDFKAFWCSSWLLNPHVEEIMGRATNISRFGDMFKRYGTTDEDGVYGNLFGMSKTQNLDEFPEETSLQRNIKKYLKDGNSFDDYKGSISLEEFDKLLSDTE